MGPDAGMSDSLFEQLPLFPDPALKAPAHRARHLQLGNRIVAYTLRQGRRRRLTLTIDERGLTIGAPVRVTLAEIQAFVASHGAWVLKKLDEYAGSGAPRHLTMKDGARLPILGDTVGVRVVSGANRARWEGQHLVLEARPDADCDALAKRALKLRAAALFAERVNHYAGRMGRPAPTLGLSGARTRWGSCNEKSGIRLNWRLIHLPLSLVDYVVAHELAHLVEMNHGPRFWAVVENLYPDWRAARRELRAQAAQIPII